MGRDNSTKRPVILVDFDGTIASSQKTAYELYQKDTGDYSKEYTNNHGWNFEGLIPKRYCEQAINYFSEQRFFDALELNREAAITLRDLSEFFEIIIVTRHDPDGVSMKAQWIKNKLPFIKRVVYLDQEDMNKGHIIGDIIIDDNVDCLESSLAPFKICFGNYGYNEDYDGIKANNWTDVGCIIFNFYDSRVVDTTYPRYKWENYDRE